MISRDTFYLGDHPERGVQLARAVADHDHDVEQLCRGEGRRFQEVRQSKKL